MGVVVSAGKNIKSARIILMVVLSGCQNLFIILLSHILKICGRGGFG